MAVPDLPTLFLPVLQSLADGQEHPLSEVREHIASDLKLTPAQLAEAPNSTTQPRFTNNVSWAAIHLNRAGALKRAKPGVYQITDAGCQLLTEDAPITLEKLQILRGEAKATGIPMPANIEPAESLRAGLENILATYDRSEKFGVQSKVWIHFQQTQAALLFVLGSLQREHVNCYWRAGIGQFTAVPWIMVYDDRETTSSQRGVYCVFLFAADMSGVYLTLHQGATEVIHKFGRSKGREALRQRAEELRRYVEPLALYGFRWDVPIDLRAQQALALDYEHATVAHKFYAAGQIPNDADLIDDLDALLEVYQTIVTDRPGAPPGEQRWWIFQVNPELYDLSAALHELNEITFEVNRYADDIHIGDHVFLWVSGKEGGLIALATVLGEPQAMQMPEGELSFAVDEQRFSEPSLRVPIHIERRADNVIPRGTLKQDPRLEDLSILRFSQGTNFPVTAEQAAILLDLLKSGPSSNTEHVWLFTPGRDAELWEELYRERILAIDWDDMGDFSQYADLDALNTRMKEVYEADRKPRNDALACFEFSHIMRPGDVVFASQGNTLLGYGVVTGDYRFDNARRSFKHVRSMRWDGRGNWRAPSKFAIQTLTDITPYPDFTKQLKDLVRGPHQNAVVETTVQKLTTPYTVDDAMKDVFLDRAEFERILPVWSEKMNLILQGPPGVGKTFLARRLAYALMGHKDPSRLGMVQFHPTYAYEDFIQGYRPSGQGFSLKNGLFYDFCKRAMTDQSATYVFIIDEINRGNLGKVFGEMMMLLEADKRGSEWSVPLTYSPSGDDQFYVPSNVYLLGMMNTADRSLSLVDYALRRRFAFVPLKPGFDSDTFRDHLKQRGADGTLIAAIIDRIAELNAEICKDRNLGPGFSVGHSYFCGNAHTPTEAWYQDVMLSEVVPLLEEYWFDDLERVSKWRKHLLKQV